MTQGEFMRRVRRLQWPLLAVLALLCVLALAAGGSGGEGEPSSAGTELETRLERVLSCIEGAGRVRVMIREESGVQSAFAPQQESKAEGVVIVCEGADDMRVRLALEQAAQALLGVDYSRIQVVKMEGGTP